LALGRGEILVTIGMAERKNSVGSALLCASFVGNQAQAVEYGRRLFLNVEAKYELGLTVEDCMLLGLKPSP